MNKLHLYRRNLADKLRLFARHPATLYFYLRYYVEDLGGAPIDLSVVSCPKSGRTWLEALLVEVGRLDRGDGTDYRTWRDLRRVHPELPRVRFTHAGSSWESVIHDQDEITRMSLEPYAKGRVLFVHRDPRDVLVSSYHHMRHRTGITAVTPEDMITDPVLGLRKVVRFMNRWLEYVQTHPEHAMRASYEALKKEPEATLKRICAFGGLEVPDGVLAAAVANCRFDKMQQKERAGGGGNPWMMPRDPGNIGSYKVRSGKVGEYRELFDTDQIERIDRILAEELDPAFGYR